jgi:hypothetical protein
VCARVCAGPQLPRLADLHRPGDKSLPIGDIPHRIQIWTPRFDCRANWWIRQRPSASSNHIGRCPRHGLMSTLAGFCCHIGTIRRPRPDSVTGRGGIRLVGRKLGPKTRMNEQAIWGASSGRPRAARCSESIPTLAILLHREHSNVLNDALCHVPSKRSPRFHFAIWGGVARGHDRWRRDHRFPSRLAVDITIKGRAVHEE